MSQKHAYQVARREATVNEIKKAKQNLNTPSATMLARVALAVIYMYLIMMSYTVMGISGPVFISLVFLVAFFIPWGYANLRRRLAQGRTQNEQPKVRAERQQEA
jgi:ABC-type transport system involved in cytochrome bd biosynthesis fused ATPase/permease subunit